MALLLDAQFNDLPNTYGDSPSAELGLLGFAALSWPDIAETEGSRGKRGCPKHECVRVRVVRGPKLRSGMPTIAGFMPVRVLLPEGYTIPWYDTRTKKGYQRQPQDARINQLANDLRKERTDLPMAVLLNIRNKEAPKAVRDDALELDLLSSETLSNSMSLMGNTGSWP